VRKEGKVMLRVRGRREGKRSGRAKRENGNEKNMKRKRGE
jgi:hypothetical protein